MTNKLRR